MTYVSANVPNTIFIPQVTEHTFETENFPDEFKFGKIIHSSNLLTKHQFLING